MNQKMILFYITIVLYVVFLAPLMDWDVKNKALAALIIVQILWIGRVFPLAFSSILFILILSFHFFTFEETLSYFGTDIIWLLFSTFIIAGAFIETGLASRISLKMLRLSKGSGKQLIFLSFILMFVLSLFVPSNIGKGSLVSSVLDGIVKNLERVTEVPNLAKSLFIGVAYIVAISGAFVATGASSTIYAYGMLADVSPKLSFIHWVLYFGPPILIFMILLYLLFLYCFPPENIDQTLVLQFIDQQLEQLGGMSKSEIKILCIIGLTLTLWITESVHGFSVPMIAMLGASLTILPHIGVFNWNRAKTKINWDMILFFAATLMVSEMLMKTGTVKWLASSLIDAFDSFPPYMIFIFLVLCTAVLRIIFVNVLGFLTVIIPLAITVGQSIPTISPFVIAMAVFLTGIPGFLLITQSPVHLVSFSYGYFKEKDLLHVGKYALGIWLLIVIGSVFFYWSWVI